MKRWFSNYLYKLASLHALLINNICAMYILTTTKCGYDYKINSGQK